VRLPIGCDASYEQEFVTAERSRSIFDAIVSSCELSRAIPMADGTEFLLDTSRIIFADPDVVETGALPAIHGPLQTWIEAVQDLRERVEGHAQRAYDVCVCILYESGHSGVAFHSDLVAYGDVSSIASVSLGQQRRFVFRDRDDHDDTFELELADGSLLLMGDRCQERYEHALPVDPERVGPRINLTFRTLGWPS
jgi:hypothetical protein